MIENEKWDHIAKHKDKPRSNKPKIFLLCFLLLVCATLGVSVFAAKQQNVGTEFTIEYEGKSPYKFTLNEDGVSYTLSEFLAKDAVEFKADIPATYRRRPVTAIAESVFANSKIVSLTIPEYVTSIGASAFSGCNLLRKVYYNASKVDVFDYSAFRGIGSASSGINFVIGDNVTHIPDMFLCGIIFGGFNMTSLTIGRSVNNVGTLAFCGLNLLEVINYNATNIPDENIMDTGGYAAFANSTGRLIIGDNVTHIPANLFGGSSVAAAISSVIIGQNVESISDNAFLNVKADVANLSSLHIDKGTTNNGAIGAQALSVNNMIELLEYIEQDQNLCIQMNPYGECDPNGIFVISGDPNDNMVDLIVSDGFRGLRAKELIIQDGIQIIADEAFAWSYISVLTLVGRDITQIGDSAFSDISQQLTKINYTPSEYPIEYYYDSVFDGLGYSNEIDLTINLYEGCYVPGNMFPTNMHINNLVINVEADPDNESETWFEMNFTDDTIHSITINGDNNETDIRVLSIFDNCTITPDGSSSFTINGGVPFACDFLKAIFDSEAFYFTFDVGTYPRVLKTLPLPNGLSSGTIEDWLPFLPSDFINDAEEGNYYTFSFNGAPAE